LAAHRKIAEIDVGNSIFIPSLMAEVALVVAAGVGAVLCLVTLTDRLPGNRNVFGSGLRPQATPDRSPAQLLRLAHIVEWSSASALDAHTRLRPELIAIADVRLARRGLRLPEDLAEARRLLGPVAWAFLRPDRPVPASRDAPGITEGELEQILTALEAL